MKFINVFVGQFAIINSRSADGVMYTYGSDWAQRDPQLQYSYNSYINKSISLVDEQCQRMLGGTIVQCVWKNENKRNGFVIAQSVWQVIKSTNAAINDGFIWLDNHGSLQPVDYSTGDARQLNLYNGIIKRVEAMHRSVKKKIESFQALLAEQEDQLDGLEAFTEYVAAVSDGRFDSIDAAFINIEDPITPEKLEAYRAVRITVGGI